MKAISWRESLKGELLGSLWIDVIRCGVTYRIMVKDCPEWGKVHHRKKKVKKNNG